MLVPETSMTCFLVLNDPGVKGRLSGLRNLASSQPLPSPISTLISFFIGESAVTVGITTGLEMVDC